LAWNGNQQRVRGRIEDAVFGNAAEKENRLMGAFSVCC
jgi:hypothetical protein